MTRHEIPLDASAILRVLSDHRVDYVVIGGLAVQAHGHPRTTQDLDLIPDPSPDNLERLRAALSELRARPVGEAEPADIAIPATGVLELDTDAGGVDVHRAPPGAAPYAQLRIRALELELDVTVAVAGRDDLIAMKRASGRPIDRGDILALTEPDPT
ncbi:MAG: nucleotidyl transferase AbiEii/AbiGii toxin family protein [Solirubrobacteraceae bacterium]